MSEYYGDEYNTLPQCGAVDEHDHPITCEQCYFCDTCEVSMCREDEPEIEEYDEDLEDNMDNNCKDGIVNLTYTGPVCVYDHCLFLGMKSAESLETLLCKAIKTQHPVGEDVISARVTITVEPVSEPLTVEDGDGNPIDIEGVG